MPPAAPILPSFFQTTLSSSSSCRDRSREDRTGGLSGATYIIFGLYEAYMPAEYKSGIAYSTSLLVWMVYAYVQDFMSSAMTAVQILMRSQLKYRSGKWLDI